jgi:hypothetical protein
MEPLAVGASHPDISFMKSLLLVAGIVMAAALGAAGASAQIVQPGGSAFNPPLPPPPPLPGPKIGVPVIPKLDELPSYNYVPAPRPSFSDKVNTCLGEATAGGLGPGDRDAYVRGCVNSR